MRKEIIIALRVTLVTLVLTGLIYPLATTGVPQACSRQGPTAAWSTTRRARWSARS